MEKREISSHEKDIIQNFVDDYQKKFDFFEMASKLAASMIENELQKNAIRAIVTYRAKNPTRLQDKIMNKALSSETEFNSLQHISEKINDLAGVRVSLYFFGDMNRAKSIIQDCFQINENEIKYFHERIKKTKNLVIVMISKRDSWVIRRLISKLN